MNTTRLVKPIQKSNIIKDPIIVPQDSWNDKEWDSKLDALRYASKVHSQTIEEVISSDFVLAKLTDKDREFIYEMEDNAYALREMLLRYRLEVSLKDKNRDVKLNSIEQIANLAADRLRLRTMMIALLSRNVDKNHILQLLGHHIMEEESNNIPLEPVKESLLDKAKRKLNMKRKDEDEE